MQRLRIADADIMRVAIQQEIVRSEEARYDHRLHGLLLIAADQSTQQVAELFGEDRRTVQRWIKTFEARGLEGLREGERPGRPKSLGKGQMTRLGCDLRRPPSALGFPAGLWDGKLLSEHLRRHYGVDLGVRQCQRLFRQLGFRLRKPRPQVAQADPVKVKTFKKTASAGQRERH